MAIRAKLVIIFFLIIIAPMFLLWARWQRTALGGIKAVMTQGLADRASEISDQVTRALQDHRDQITKLTKQPGMMAYARTVTQSGQTPIDDKLKIDLTSFFTAHYKEYSALIIINRRGSPLFKLEPGEDRGVPRAYYEDAKFTSEDTIIAPGGFAPATDQIYYSEVQRDTSGLHVKLIAPMRDQDNNVTSALVIKLRTEELLAEAVGPRLIESSEKSSPEAVILNPAGVVLYSSDPGKQGRMYDEAFQDLGDIFSLLREGKVKGYDRDQWVFSSYLRDSQAPKLSILMIGDYSKSARQLENDGYVMLLMTMLLVIVAMLALYYLISQITDSIRRVTRGAKMIAMGQLTYQIKIKAKDETRVLAEAFNRMADRLRDMIRKEGEQKQFESFARLSSVLTHDLKNQILSLSLLVNNMERKFDREGFKEDAMRTLSESVSNLQNLVAKLSDPRTPTRRFRERSNLSLLVERVIQRTAAQASGKYKVASDLDPELFALVDGKAVERVIENLVINALEAMPDGGSLRLLTWRDNGSAFVAVADTGKGMSEEFMRERLFHPFATTKKKGIGLGLYSCRDIIEQHGGRIDVASRVDVGTEFKIILPLKAEDLSTGDLKSAAVASGPI